MLNRLWKRLILVSLVFLLLIASSSVRGEEITESFSFKTRPMAEQDSVYELLVNEQVVLRYRSMAGGMNAAQRAAAILERIKVLGSRIVEGPVNNGIINGSPVITVQGQLLITVTQSDWEANNSTGDGLARVWAENLRKALHIVDNGKTSILPGDQPGGNTDPHPEDQVGEAELRMLELVNRERAEAGVKPLEMDPQLVKIARLKSQDMIANKYFDHNSPTYGDPFTMLQNQGVKFKSAGENLAGDQTVEKAYQALMNSPGHRKNILNPDYTHIGIGIVEGGPYGTMFTQLFIGK